MYVAMADVPAVKQLPVVALKAGSQYDATLTRRDAGRGVNYAGIGSISNPASRCVSVVSYCEPVLSVKAHR